MPDDKPTPENASVPWNDVVRFVRQLSHDLRNHLNAVELQAVFLNELTNDAEMKGEIKRLREMMSALGGTLQKLSAALTQPKPNLIPYRAADFMEDIRRKFENDLPDKKSAVQWQVETGDAMLDVDPQLLQEALLELFDNALRQPSPGAPITVTGRIEGKRFVITLREAKPAFDRSTENWGREPLRTASQGHYGLGLNRVRSIVEVHGGEFGAAFDAGTSELVTTIVLPVSPAGT